MFFGLPLLDALLDGIDFNAWRPKPGVRTHDGFRKPLPPPDLERARISGTLDRTVLEFMAAHDRGAIRIGSARVRPGLLIAQMLQAWPDRYFFLTTRDRRPIRPILREVNRCPLMTTHLGDGLFCLPAAPLRDIKLWYHWTDFALVLDPARIVRDVKGGLEALKRIPARRLYAIVPPGEAGEPLGPELRAMFGDAAVTVPAHGCERVPVRVVRLGSHGDARYGDADFLAGLAYCMARRDRREVERRFPQLAEHMPMRPARVGVAVDDLATGLGIARLLRWPLLHDEAPHGDASAPEGSELLAAGETNGGRRKRHVVLTRNGYDRASRVAILIRADRGGGLPPVPRRHLVRPIDGSRRLLVVDPLDAGNADYTARETAYRLAGWELTGEDATA